MPYQGNIRDPNDPQYDPYADDNVRRQNAAIDPTSADTQAGFQWNPNMSQAENASLRNEYQYGGHGTSMYVDAQGNRRIVPGTSGAEQATARYSGLADQARGTQAPTTNYGQANQDYGQYGQAQQFAYGARGSQQDALALQRSAAMGQQPSVAQQQLQYGMNRGLAQNMSMAASARGGGANLAAANRAAMNSNAQLAGQTNAQAGMLRAQEMQQARDAYMGGASGIRGQDLGQQGAALQARGQSAQQAQFGTSAELQQRGLNAQTGLGYDRLANDVNTTQLQADIARRNNQEQHWAGQSGLDAHSTDRTTEATNSAIRGVTGIIAGSDIRVKHDIHPGDQAAEQAMDQRQAYTYKYNDPKLGKDPPAGVMAQELERSPAGAAAVIDTPQGKAIDGKQALSLMLAENANLHHRLKALEVATGGGAVAREADTGLQAAARGVAAGLDRMGDAARAHPRAAESLAFGGAAPALARGAAAGAREVYAYGRGREPGRKEPPPPTAKPRPMLSFSRDPRSVTDGVAKPGPYATSLTPDEESAFSSWVKTNRVPYDLSAPVDQQDYDMRGYWKAQRTGDASARQDPKNMHFPDTWKTPLHESFSNESMYATERAPHWDGDVLVPSGGGR
jgi:hypothetical protein